MKNFKDWKTTILGILTIIITILVGTGIISTAQSGEITTNTGIIVTAIFSLITGVTGLIAIFKAKSN